MRLVTGFLVLALAMAPALPASIIVYQASLNGASEVPPNASTGTGFITVTLDTVANTLLVSETFSGLIGGAAAAAHIHCCIAAGSNAIVAVPFTGFPAATSGSYSPSAFDLTLVATYNAPFVTASGGTAALAEAALISGLNSGLAYANIHNATFPGGEIRGQLAAVPEPATLLLSGGALLMLALLRRR